MAPIFIKGRTMQLTDFLVRLNNNQEEINFADTIATIDANFLFTPAAFDNGNVKNEAGQNSGSCKIFAFAHLQGLSSIQTLHCFGDYYRIDVLKNPGANDHQNIRNFMTFGWEGICFHGAPLKQKTSVDN